MQQYDIEELMALDWIAELAPDPDGGVVLMVHGLDDFAVCGTSADDVLAQYEDALRSHLGGYLATGKVVPVPAGCVIQEHQDTGGVGEWTHLGFNAVTGKTRREPAAA